LEPSHVGAQQELGHEDSPKDPTDDRQDGLTGRVGDQQLGEHDEQKNDTQHAHRTVETFRQRFRRSKPLFVLSHQALPSSTVGSCAQCYSSTRINLFTET